MTITISLEGEHALVTGASSGIGAHMAATLAAAGAVVTLAARRIERLEELRDQLRGQGAQVEAIALDVTDTPSLPDRLAATANALGTPGILVNNAGIAVTRSALDHSEDDWDAVMNTNLKGVFFTAQAFARNLRQAVEAGERKGGSIINTASITGLNPAGSIIAYATAKAGVVHLTKCLAGEWARYGIRVNAIAPGYIETDINRDYLQGEGGQKLTRRIPQRRVGQVDDLDGVLLLLADEKRGGFITGSIYTVDGGHVVQSL
ncbi:MAG: 2-deoxy-D-gluconate 3-dehydrogenase [Alphaproteobacteria bacterium]|nr:2-deoxy-D-gluconate 3-dehydrogenase [Alphaproteobacteria bacterium]MAS45979.1 2-deoxy-D-gluconate 3-dehydrogenase [Alphaproteobacteria bacterium]MAX95839.1 2-deoxy-D-gluconate 3-dehydrogenase [Alphaproteobacteria bacterium]MBN54027.1 2-deoxy-D-gluconate 3-dehydrogenase [Alphaproteobacteria bacterium]OUT42385.1 MAG: 2-deoxy-D-gluconate 3-dehydrogenase [Micavibrio sp. TMED2]|tara:strand:+ start:18667 stop:19452 length:786 start_codon:yes stop_codon:yes gene_type:complete